MNVWLLIATIIINLTTLLSVIVAPSAPLAFAYLVNTIWVFGLLYYCGFSTKILTMLTDQLVEIRSELHQTKTSSDAAVNDLKSELSMIKMSMGRK